jgi:hypothetical protein
MDKMTMLQEAAMLRSEIIRTCSHEKVAEAALQSIGPLFHERISLLAATMGLEPGPYVAGLVRRFAEEAGPQDMRALDAATGGADMPVLAGLRFIVEAMIDGAHGPRTRAARVQDGPLRSACCA